MRRLILGEVPNPEGYLTLGSKEYRHLVRVLRLGIGDQFRALLPSGTEALFQIVEVKKTTLEACRIEVPDGGTSVSSSAPASARADEERRRSLPQVPPIILCQALPRGQKMDLIVRQATEAGVSLIIPFVSKHSVPRLDRTASLQKQERWSRIIREARQQSGSDMATRVEAITDIEGVIAFREKLARHQTGSRALLLHQDPLAKETLHRYLGGYVESVLITVGPEGGFSNDEAANFMKHGFNPLLLGVNVLRTETAAIFATAAVQVLLLEKASWNLSNR